MITDYVEFPLNL